MLSSVLDVRILVFPTLLHGNTYRTLVPWSNYGCEKQFIADSYFTKEIYIL